MTPDPAPEPTTRRTFLRRAAAGLFGGGALTAGYGLWEASRIVVRRETVAVPHLPEAFHGKTVAVLADLHHGPFVGLPFVRAAVERASALAPDLIALVGDFAHKGRQASERLPPCLEALDRLRAPLGVFAVPGNHDMKDEGAVYRETVATTAITDVTNRRAAITVDGQRLWVAGVDDLWWGKPDLDAALRGMPAGEAVVLLSHNPDFAEERPDRRVGLVLSGHTHGGQVYLPGIGSPWLPSKYGYKYRCG
ncbi:MAG: metallophosphoesterase, partial [Gemmataceae bacterium]